MNGVHDMGGMHGFGPIERDEIVFHAEWEAHVSAMQTLTGRGRYFNLDEFRYGIEQMPPADYLRSSYFERWLATLEYNLIKKGLISSDELEARTKLLIENPEAELPRTAADNVPTSPPQPQSDTSSLTIVPRYNAGDAVVTRNTHPAGHTRLPRYARGKRGVIHIVHGPEVFADTNAHGLGEDVQVVYNVRFDARELWGESAEPGQSVYIDLWQSYLKPATS